MGAAADGGEMSSSAANSTTSAPRLGGTVKQATTCRDGQELLQSFQGQQLGQLICGQGGKVVKLNYMNIKNLLDRRQALDKKGTLTDGEFKSLVK
jgi:hypothetical protein